MDPLRRALLPSAHGVNFGPTVFIRTMLKTHKATAKRWKKTASGKFKHGATMRQHGNSGWNNTSLSHAKSRLYAQGKGDGNHIRRLRRLLPFA